MATFDITITYPDNAQTRILDALKTHYTTLDANGDPVVPTNGQAVDAFRDSVRDALKKLVLKVERDEALKAAADGVSEVDVT